MGQKRVLVVDDEELMRWYLRERLTQLGLEVIEASCGAEALGLAPGVDLMLIDYQLPDLTGLEVIRRLRELPRRGWTILMTAGDSAVLREKADALGARFLEKPFRFDALVAAVQGCLEVQSGAGPSGGEARSTLAPEPGSGWLLSQ